MPFLSEILCTLFLRRDHRKTIIFYLNFALLFLGGAAARGRGADPHGEHPDWESSAQGQIRRRRRSRQQGHEGQEEVGRRRGLQELLEVRRLLPVYNKTPVWRNTI